MRGCTRTDWVLNCGMNLTQNIVVAAVYKLGHGPRVYSQAPGHLNLCWVCIEISVSVPAHSLGTQCQGESNSKYYCSLGIWIVGCSEGVFCGHQTISSWLKCTWNWARVCLCTQWILNSGVNPTPNITVVSLYKLGHAPRAYSIHPRPFAVALSVHEIGCEFARALTGYSIPQWIQRWIVL